MDIVQNFPFITIVLMMVSSIVCFVVSGKSARTLSLIVIAMVALFSACTLIKVMEIGASYIYTMGHFPAPWGNELRVGVLESVFALLFAIVVFFSLLGGMKHILEDVPEEKWNRYFMMIDMLLASLLVLNYTNDLFTAYVFVEINTFTACSIVMLKEGKKTVVATMQYLIMSLVGSGLLLIAISILYSITGHLLMEHIHDSIVLIAQREVYLLPLTVLVGFFVVSIAIKGALYPFHGWLPDAHGASTSSSSAILSGVVLKGYIILLLKILYRVIGREFIAETGILEVLFVLGLVGMIFASIMAMREHDLKRMLAYSSVAQIGYIYLGLGLGTTVGIVAACFHMIVHAITKPMLFCAAGGFMEVSNHSNKFDDISGAGRRNRLAGFAFTVGALSMIGIPLFGGFASKWYLASASFHSPQTMVFALMTLIISTVLNALYYVPAWMLLYRREIPIEEDEHGEEIGEYRIEKFHNTLGFRISMIFFMVMTILLGIQSEPIINMLELGIQMFI